MVCVGLSKREVEEERDDYFHFGSCKSIMVSYGLDLEGRKQKFLPFLCPLLCPFSSIN